MRCDRCTARAVVTATKGESVLDFCGYHLRGGYVKLTSTGWDLKLKPDADGKAFWITDWMDELKRQDAPAEASVPASS